MTTAYAIQTVLEILAVLFVVYGILNEKKFVAIEDKICRIIKRKIYLHRKRKAIEKAKASKAARIETRRPEPSMPERKKIYSIQYVA